MFRREVDRLQPFYWDDDEEPRGRSNSASIFLLILSLVISGFFIKSVYAANISLNNGTFIEFGQGVSLTSACSGNNPITLIPQSTFTNVSNGGAFYFGSFIVSGVTGCSGNSLTFNAYGSTGDTPLAIFNTTGTDAVVTKTGNTYSSNSVGLTVNTLSASSFSVTFATPVATTAQVAKISVQSSMASAFATAGSLSFGSSDSLSMSSDSGVGTGAYTVDMWVKLTSAPSNNALFFSASDGLGMYINSSMDQFTIIKWGAGTGAQVFYKSILVNTWYHFALTRNGSGSSQLFINGVKANASSITDTNNYTGGPSAIFGSGAGGELQGLMSNYRMTNTNLYDPSAASITVPVAPLTAVAGTTLLLNTSLDNPFGDNSGNARTVTPSGSPTSTSANPFTG
jgi:hypothetical protein